jgi:hypothetical protein
LALWSPLSKPIGPVVFRSTLNRPFLPTPKVCK